MPLFLLIIVCCFSTENNLTLNISNISSLINDVDYCNLKEWLNQLIIDIPNDLIKEETNGALEDLTIYGISLDQIITTSPETIDNKIGVKISLKNARLDIKGIYHIIVTNNFVAHISNLNIDFPFYLVRNEENGLVSKVDTSGFNIDLDNVKISFDSTGLQILEPILILVLKIIKTNVIEKKLIETMDTELLKLFEKVNNIILNGVEPKELHISIKEQDRTDLKKSTLISAVGYLLNNLTGADGPLSLNNLVNIFTENTGIIQLHDFYNQSIHFKFNLTGGNNDSLGNVDIGLEDLNISGLNTWKNFTAIEPYNKILLRSFTDLQNLTINMSRIFMFGKERTFLLILFL